MCFDLLFGKRCRSWSRGWNAGEVPTARAPLPTSSELLERSLSSAVPAAPTVASPVSEASLELKRLYEKYHPRYRDHVLSVRTKI